MSGNPDKRVRLSDLEVGQRVDELILLVNQKELRQSNTGSLYIRATLSDPTGQIEARMWDASQTIFESLPSRGVIAVRGRMESYRGKPQFIIDAVRAIEEGQYDPADFLPTTKQDVEAMWSRVKEILRTVRNPALLQLVGRFVNDKQFADGFRQAPAARTNHHAYLGGLLEHTLNLLEMALLLLPRYPRVDADLVLVGLFLHDIGKIRELRRDTSFDYSDEGQLVGHILQGALWVHDKVRQLEAESGEPFDRGLLTRLTHIIAAHHGKYEFGSPRLPATPEAFMVHYLDNLDAKLNMVFNTADLSTDPESNWTSWMPALETRVFKPSVGPAPESD
jgi:3'-5' exoribonuclease